MNRSAAIQFSSLHLRIIGAVIALSFVLAAMPLPARAATLTQPQINSILSLLEAFGANQSTIQSVQTVLEGGTAVPPSSPSASGPMSLSISPISGSNMTTVPRTMNVFASYPLISCGNPNDTASYTVNFGDGTSEALSYSNYAIAVDGALGGECIAEWTGANHTYISAGSYTAMLYRNNVSTATQVVSVTTGSSTTLPTGTIDQSSLNSNSQAPTLTGTAANTTEVVVTIWNAAGTAAYFGSGGIPVVNGRWSVTSATPLLAGTYKVTVIDGQPRPAGTPVGTQLAVGTLTVTTPIATTGGKFTVSLSAPTSLAVSAGQVGATLGVIKLDASASSEDIDVSSIPLLPTPTFNDGDLSNCQILNNGSSLMSGNYVIDALTTGTIQNFTFAQRLLVPRGTVAILTLTCNISSAAKAGDEYSFSSVSPVNGYPSYFATGVQDGAGIVPTVITGSTGVEKIGTDTLSTTLDPSSPSYQIAAGGTTGVLLGIFDLHATGENVTVQKISLTLGSGAAPQDLSNVYLYNSSGQLLGTAQFTGSNHGVTSVLSTPLLVSQNTNTAVIVKGDIAQIGVNQPGLAGDNIILSLTTATGVGVSSGATVVGSGSITPTAGVGIFKSFPVVSLVSVSSPSITIGSSQPLLQFSVTANANGSIGILQFPFTVYSPQGVTVSNLGLYAYTDLADSQPVSGQGANGLIGSVSPSAPMNTRFFMSGTSPVEIPAGATYHFVLRGTVSGGAPSLAVATTLLGDASYNGIFVGGNSGSGNFLWSANDRGVSTTLTNDWTNSYGVPGLPSNGLTQTLTGYTPVPLPTPVSPTTLSIQCTNNGTSATISWAPVINATTYYPRVGMNPTSCPAGWINQTQQCALGDVWSNTGGITNTSVTYPTVPGKSYTAWVHAGNATSADTTVHMNNFTCSAATATINPASLNQPSTNFSISGTAASLPSAALYVVLVGSNYSGPTDWKDVQQLIVNGQTMYTVKSYSTAVSGGQWTISSAAIVGTNVTAGAYNIYVYDTSGDFLTTGLLTIKVPVAPIPGPVAEWSGSQVFNGVNTYVSLPPLPDSQAFTISAWVNYTGSSCGVVFSDSDKTSGNDLVLAVDGSNAYIRADKSGATLFGNGCPPLSMYQQPFGSNIKGAPHFVTWANTGTSSTVYLDGKSVGTVALSGSNVGYHNATPSIGREYDGPNGFYNSGADYFTGTIGQVAIYNSALSAAQISQLYVSSLQAMSVAPYPTLAYLQIPSTSDLVATVVQGMQLPYSMLTDALGNVFYALGLY